MKIRKEIDEQGTVLYYNEKNELHRTDGPAVKGKNGYKAWYINGKRHRTDGPAVEEINRDKAWFINDELHRTDGPAVEYADGDKEWWLNDESLTEEEFQRRTTRLGKALYL